MTIHIPETNELNYSVEKRRFDQHAKSLAKGTKSLIKKINKFVSLEARVGKLRRGAGIKYKVRKITGKMLRGIILKRSGPKLFILCLSRPVTHLITLSLDHPDWQNYSSRTAQRRLEKLREKIGKREKLKEFIAKIESNVERWRKLGAYPPSETTFKALTSSYLSQFRLSEKETQFANKYIAILLKAKPVNFSR